MDGNRYPTFEVCDHTGRRRKLRSFADHQAAQREARQIGGLLAKGDTVAAPLSGQEAASFARCMELLRAVGDPPELACARYAEAVGVLGNGSLLSPAARFCVERHPTTLPQITLAEAAAEMIELRRQAKASGPYLTDLRCRIGPFTKASMACSSLFSLSPALASALISWRICSCESCSPTTRYARATIRLGCVMAVELPV